jgi:hypothetical protein
MAALPDRFEVTAVLDPSPRYVGTSHEDATARAMGYRAALVPGAFVYGHVTRLALMIWGEEWLSRGTAQVRFRRPVFAGDRLSIQRGPLTETGNGIEAPVSVIEMSSSTVVVDGTIGLANTPPIVPADLAILPLPVVRTVLSPGAVPVNRPLGSTVTVMGADIVNQSLRDFHETSDIYSAKGLIHPGMLLRRTMGDTLANFDLPMPVIFAGAQVQLLAPARVGQSYATAARILRTWERNGKHYFDSEEWLLCDATPMARHIRTNIYAVDP